VKTKEKRREGGEEKRRNGDEPLPEAENKIPGHHKNRKEKHGNGNGAKTDQKKTNQILYNGLTTLKNSTEKGIGPLVPNLK